ncbi:MAG: hypothetical protein K0Q90_705 [Paenibacillaceae bacterium]|jgi:hypothetical protein|nr:hypothetical protein [Paenibacillaceae bacterium]
MAVDKKASVSKSKPARKGSSFGRGWRRYGWPVLRHTIVPFVCVLALFAGMSAGYVVLGDKPFSDVLEWNTWKHMIDLIFADS